MNRPARCLCVLLPMLPPTAFAAAAPAIESFALPGGAPTCGRAISSNGVVAGNSESLTAPVAFLYSNKTFTYPAPTLPAGTVAFTGINRKNTLTGVDLLHGSALSFTTLGFTYAKGMTTPLTISGATSTAVNGINDAGTLIGDYSTSASSSATGFVLAGSTFTPLPAVSGSSVIPTAISADGSIIVGEYLGISATGGWLYAGGAYTALNYPGATATAPSGVYAHGVVAGTYFTGSATALTAHGFIYRKGTWHSFDVPGATQTQIGGANLHGQLTGCYTTPAGATVGFIATP